MSFDKHMWGKLLQTKNPHQFEGDLQIQQNKTWRGKKKNYIVM